MKKLTKRQNEVLSFIARFLSENSYSPSIRDIADYFSISVKGAHDHVTALIKKDYVKNIPNQPRTIGLVKLDDQDTVNDITVTNTVNRNRSINSFKPNYKNSKIKNFEYNDTEIIEIPILGSIAAGKPVYTEENFDGSLKLPSTMLKIKNNRKYFALNIKGDSMIGAGIMDGDTAIIEQQEIVNNGEIAATIIEDAPVLKRFFLESSRVRLQSENPSISPMYSKDVRILGRLATIIRTY